jgi:shikimate kinase
VAALGGGTLVSERGRARARAPGRMVWLQAEPAELARRLGDSAARPLLMGLDRAGRAARLAELLAARATSYRAADLAIATDRRSAAAVADTIANWWLADRDPVA